MFKKILFFSFLTFTGFYPLYTEEEEFGLTDEVDEETEEESDEEENEDE